MRNIILIALLFTLVCSINAQKYNKAIVTDLHCYRQENTVVGSEDELPFYLHQQGFIDDVQSDVKKHLKEKYNIDSVYFLHPGEIKKTSNYVAPDLQAKEYALEHADKKSLYVEVLTKINLRAVNGGVPRYGFSTKVKVFNSKGKKAYKYTNTIPFESYKEEGITGPAQIGEQDFYAFYFDGLEYAFKGKVKKTEVRHVRKPSADFYDSFIAEAEEFIYLPVQNGFAYGKTEESAKDVLTFDGNFWHSIDDNWNFDNVFRNHNFKEGYNLTNHFNKEDYLVKIKGGDQTFFDFLTLSSDITVEFKKNKKEVIGEYELDWSNNLKGNFDGDNYRVSFNAPYGCSEFYADTEMIAIMNHFDEYDIVYVHQSATEKQLGDLFNLFFAWQYASALQAAIDAEEEDD